MYLCVRHCESTLLSSKHLISLLQVVHLLSQVEAEKLEVVRRDEEMTLASQRSMRDQEALLEAQAQLESLDARLLETQEQLEREVERRKVLEEEKERLEERLNRAGQREESGAPQAASHSVRITGSHPSPGILSSSFSFITQDELKLYCVYPSSRRLGTVSPPTAPKTGCSSRRLDMFRLLAPARPPTRTSLQRDHIMVRGAQWTRSLANCTLFPQRSTA